MKLNLFSKLNENVLGDKTLPRHTIILILKHLYYRRDYKRHKLNLNTFFRRTALDYLDSYFRNLLTIEFDVKLEVKHVPVRVMLRTRYTVANTLMGRNFASTRCERKRHYIG